jgi:ankyrin repeat protein
MASQPPNASTTATPPPIPLLTRVRIIFGMLVALVGSSLYWAGVLAVHFVSICKEVLGVSYYNDIPPEQRVAADVNGMRDLLCTSAALNNLSLVEQLLDASVDVNATRCTRNVHDQTALHYAAANGSLQVAAALIERNANIDAISAKHNTPVLLAAANDRFGVVVHLINAKANISLTNSAGQSVLHYAAAFKRVESVQLLIKHTANVNAHDQNLMTPLHRAVVAGSIEAVHALLDAKAMIDVQDREHRTPLDIAVANDRKDIIQALSYVQSKQPRTNASANSNRRRASATTHGK